MPDDDMVLLEALPWWGIPLPLPLPHRSRSRHLRHRPGRRAHSSGNGSTERDQHLGPRAVRNVSPITGGCTKPSITSPPGRRAASTIWAMSRCPRPWTTRLASRASAPSSAASPMPARARWPSVAIIRSRGDPARDRRRGLPSDRRPTRCPRSPRCPHRYLREHRALDGSQKVGRALGGLHRPSGQRRRQPRHPARHPRQHPFARLAQHLARPRLRPDRDGTLPRARAGGDDRPHS